MNQWWDVIDFNLPHTDWAFGRKVGTNSSKNIWASLLIGALLSHNNLVSNNLQGTIVIRHIMFVIYGNSQKNKNYYSMPGLYSLA